MFRKKEVNIQLSLLLVIPVYLFFLINFMQGYHSHVNANGIIITHSNCSDSCSYPTRDSNGQKDNEQIIIFHGFLQICGDNIKLICFNEYVTEYSSQIEIPQPILHGTEIQSVKKGRAPPQLV